MKRALMDFLVTYLVVLALLLVLRPLPTWASVVTLGVTATLAVLALAASVWLAVSRRQESDVRCGSTVRHEWRVTRSETPGRFDAYVFDKRDGTPRAEFVGYFESPDDAAEAAIESALVLDRLTR